MPRSVLRTPPRFGKRERQRVPELRCDAAVQPPLDAKRTGIIAVGLNDARLDLDLRLGSVQVGNELIRGGQPFLKVGDDERIGTLDDLDLSTRRKDRVVMSDARLAARA